MDVLECARTRERERYVRKDAKDGEREEFLLASHR